MLSAHRQLLQGRDQCTNLEFNFNFFFSESHIMLIVFYLAAIMILSGHGCIFVVLVSVFQQVSGWFLVHAPEQSSSYSDYKLHSPITTETSGSFRDILAFEIQP
jgi:hypothetical protein